MNLSKEYFTDLTSQKWKDVCNKCLIGRNEKGYLTLRILMDNILEIHNEIKILNQEYNNIEIYIKNEHTTRGIENISYKRQMTILEDRLDYAVSSLNKFINTFKQIPYIGGRILCIIDYLIHGIQWVCIEIESNTIENRLDKTNCISYIEEAEKLTRRKFNKYVN